MPRRRPRKAAPALNRRCRHSGALYDEGSKERFSFCGEPPKMPELICLSTGRDVMTNETSENSKNTVRDDAKTLKADVRRAVEKGDDIQENVRRLTLMALGGEAVDLEVLRRTMSAVVEGARDGIQQQMQETTDQSQAARTKITEAVTGLELGVGPIRRSLETRYGRSRRSSSKILR